MGEYLAMRIAGGHLDYLEVVAKYPQFKEEIDRLLIEGGNGDKIKTEEGE